MAWFVSNCASKSGREELVKELKKLVNPLRKSEIKNYNSLNPFSTWKGKMGV